MGVGPRRSQRETWLGPRCPSRSSCSDGTARLLARVPPGRGRAGPLSCAPMPRGSADHSPEGVSIRSRVNEYGGGALCLVSGHSAGAFAYVDQSDQGVWLCDGAARPGPCRWRLCAPPPAGEVHRHGGLCATAEGDWVLAVRETHREGSAGPVRSVVALSTRAGSPCESTLLEGHDFFGTPRPHPDGDRLAVVAWDHPDMPWDASTCLARAARPRRLRALHGARDAPGIGSCAAGGGRPGGIGGPALVGPGRVVAVRLRPDRLVAALPAFGTLGPTKPLAADRDGG